jgi:GNAT superfamily N-acetyltransferase
VTSSTATPFELDRGGVVVSTDPARLDFDLVHRFLSEEAYWSPGVPREVVERSIDASIAFGAYRDGAQVGFARAVTDRATFAWLADVFVVSGERGSGIGKLLVEAALAHPELQTLRRWVLATADAHELYARYGFVRLDERFMVRESEAARRACAGGAPG